MIDDRFVEFMGGPYALVLASRDKDLAATCTYAFGLSVEKEANTVVVFVPNAIAGNTFDNLAANGRAALLIGHGDMHETYQFKGRFLGARPTTEHEQTLQKIHQARVATHFRREWGDRSPKYWNSFPTAPSTAVSMLVEHIYDQTPGPNAGRRLGL